MVMAATNEISANCHEQSVRYVASPCAPRSFTSSKMPKMRGAVKRGTGVIVDVGVKNFEPRGDHTARAATLIGMYWAPSWCVFFYYWRMAQRERRNQAAVSAPPPEFATLGVKRWTTGPVR